MSSAVLTKKSRKDLAKAKRAAKSGNAFHWPTIASILLEEVERLEHVIRGQ